MIRIFKHIWKGIKEEESVKSTNEEKKCENLSTVIENDAIVVLNENINNTLEGNNNSSFDQNNQINMIHQVPPYCNHDIKDNDDKDSKKYQRELFLKKKRSFNATLTKKTEQKDIKYNNIDEYIDNIGETDDFIESLKEEVRINYNNSKKQKYPFSIIENNNHDIKKIKYTLFETFTMFFNNKEIGTLMLRGNVIQDVIDVETDFTIPNFTVQRSLQWVFEKFNYQVKYSDFLAKLITSSEKNNNFENFLLLPRQWSEITESEYFITKMNLINYAQTNPIDYNYKNKSDAEFHRVDWFSHDDVILKDYEMEVSNSIYFISKFSINLKYHTICIQSGYQSSN